MYIDSHCHLDKLDLSAFDGCLDAVLQDAKNNQIKHLLTVCVDYQSFENIQQICTEYPSIDCSIGIHPLNDDIYDEARFRAALASELPVVAIGETGLDYYYKQNYEEQKQKFRHHIELAVEVDKPLIIHTRDARQDTISILNDYTAQGVRGVLHCFTESLEMAQQALDMGLYLSFSGICTFNNAKALREVIKHTPMDKLLIETDSPYLAPVPYRGKSNIPSYLPATAKLIAELKQMSVEDLAKQTADNYYALFGDGHNASGKKKPGAGAPG